MRRLIENYGSVILAAVVFLMMFILAYNVIGPVKNSSNESMNNFGDNTVVVKVENRTSKGLLLEEYTIKGIDGESMIIEAHHINGYDTPISQSFTFDKELNNVIEFTYNPTEYEIVYELDGGQLSSTMPTSFTIEDETFYLSIPVKEGYRFIGWSGVYVDGLDMDCSVEKGSFGDRKYIANWELPS